MIPATPRKRRKQPNERTLRMVELGTALHDMRKIIAVLGPTLPNEHPWRAGIAAKLAEIDATLVRYDEWKAWAEETFSLKTAVKSRERA